jgi:hypothetical protein
LPIPVSGLLGSVLPLPVIFSSQIEPDAGQTAASGRTGAENPWVPESSLMPAARAAALNSATQAAKACCNAASSVVAGLAGTLSGEGTDAWGSCDEPGIFVAFDETPERIVANFEGFGWNLGPMQPKSLFFLNIQPTAELIQSGRFDLGGTLAALGARSMP